MKLTEEEYENRELSVEERESLDPFVSMKGEQNASPAVIVRKGRCAMINCQIFDCKGAGVLVCNDSEEIKELLLYVKGCSIKNCMYSGAEARQYGTLILEDCRISENRCGIAALQFASNVMSSITDEKALSQMKPLPMIQTQGLLLKTVGFTTTNLA